jgi:hypothetical protein
MKKFNTTFLLVVAVLVVAVFLYYYFNPSKPWLEGFALRSNAYPSSSLMSEGFADSMDYYPPDSLSLISYLIKYQQNKDITVSTILDDIKTVTACSTSDKTKIMKPCFEALVNKYEVVPEYLLHNSSTANLEIRAIENVILPCLMFRKGIMDPKTFNLINFEKSVRDYMATLPDICAITKVGNTEYVKPMCYNALLQKFVLDVPVPAAPAEQKPVVPAQSTKDYRVSFFKNLALIAGETKLKTDAIEAAYDKMASCKKDNSDYDIDCFHELAAEFDITITKEAMDSVGVPTDKKKDSTIDDVLSTALKALKKDTKADEKCKVEFGKEPPVEIPDVSKPESTCTTTSDVVKDTKTPAVSQGCDFANKFPKVNVINLRDYVHKDEIPCWSCKL